MKKRESLPSSISCREGDVINYPDALQGLSPFSDIYILPPIGKFKDYIFLFPDFSLNQFRGNETINHPHRNFIYYQAKWFEPKELFGRNRAKNNSITSRESVYSTIRYYETFLNGKGYYKLPCRYFDLTTPKQQEFKQQAIQPIRDLLGKFRLLSPDNRGKGNEIVRQARQKRTHIIVKLFKQSNGKRSNYIQFIQKRLPQEYENKFPNDDSLYETFCNVSDSLIRRTLKKEGLV